MRQCTVRASAGDNDLLGEEHADCCFREVICYVYSWLAVQPSDQASRFSCHCTALKRPAQRGDLDSDRHVIQALVSSSKMSSQNTT